MKAGFRSINRIIICVVLISLITCLGAGCGKKEKSDKKYVVTQPTESASTDNNKTEGGSGIEVDGDNIEVLPGEDPENPNATVPNSDSWFGTAKLIKPYMTNNTVSLEKADLSLLNSTDEKAWDNLSLFPTALEGTLNSTEGISDPNKQQQLSSTYMVLIDAETGEIIAERDSAKVIYPASMTKILTVLTAMDYITDDKLDDTFVITQDIVDDVVKNDMSNVGFRTGDVVTVRDLLYGTIVCSGGDAAIGLARYCLGTEEAFVEKMNENAKLMGLSDDTHFTNPVGIYNDDLHTTMQDMAVILSVAMQNERLADVLSTRIYTTNVQFAYNDANEIVDVDVASAGDSYSIKGKEISNWFIRRIEDKSMDGKVVGAKTGYVSQSGNCAASYYVANSGKKYICVTGNSYSSWRTIYDHVGVYRSFAK